MTADEFVPVGFDPPTSLTTEQFRLEPLASCPASTNFVPDAPEI